MKGILEDFIRPFYKDSSKKYQTGQLGWAPILFTPSRDELRILNFDSEGNIKGTEKLKSNSFTYDSHPPITYEFKLEATEEVLCIKAKKRPIILLECPRNGEIWELIPKNKKLSKHLRLEKVWMAVPVYSYLKTGEIEIFKQLVEFLYFPSFFPLPSYKNCPRGDSFCRLEHIQPVHMSLIELCEHKLSEIAFQVLKENVISFLLNEPHGELYPFFKEEFLKKLKDKGIIKE